ncbi:MAG: hypothetical protein US49_C0002G0066 [candidate division TM6 bacterium GW2011_GWF2_37_49]|nr:MAG: hypothetical protein US49_C0002G0066 [candidate division TM6 bacterium GW2011_GWF2_37_49]
MLLLMSVSLCNLHADADAIVEQQASSQYSPQTYGMSKTAREFAYYYHYNPSHLNSLDKAIAGKDPHLSDVDEHGCTLLIDSVILCDEKLTKKLIQYGLNLEAVTHDGLYKGDTPLLIAAKQNSTITARIVIGGGADLNKTDLNGRTAFSYAVENDNSEIAIMLLRHGLKTGIEGEFKGAPLHLAVVKNCKKDVEKLIKNKTNINANIATGCFNGLTPLHFAAIMDNSETIKLLIKAGAVVNAKYNKIYPEAITEGITPLHLAAGLGNIDAVRTLLENGADIDAISTTKYMAFYFRSEKRTPLLNALEGVNEGTKYESVCMEVAKLLKEKGANLEAEIVPGKTISSYLAALHLYID